MKTIIKFATVTATALALFGAAQAGPPGKGYPGSSPLRATRDSAHPIRTTVHSATCADCGATTHSPVCAADQRMTCNGCKKSAAPALGRPSGKRMRNQETACVNASGKKCKM